MSIPSTSHNHVQFRLDPEQVRIVQEHMAHFDLSKNMAARMIFERGIKRDIVSLGMEFLVERTTAIEELLKAILSDADKQLLIKSQSETEERLSRMRQRGLL